ncbi:hypothetical protein IBE48_00820 [Francisella philomiragia]|uniref:Uncharacterized protein n=1 Tax=Francisella philomiragia TaxID=28110 RepID=A0AAW3D9A2_9GAMM|nr:hypothetical protein [Francisella philomiragia]KFJ42070.1 hypothetical protein DR78_163 [Francisella philomiragia]MBK2026007.1 hypothetical protein [Francisella philomiragia]MBK2093386.1 hypothetical protein [Francisella philomiragia]MBK2254169.1 hypothetical protein [Francisella philomiragia]MBK2255856.1 hypothetical protein [Francisella philomiragia]
MIFLEKQNNNAETLAYIGHVDNVIHGIVPEELKYRRFLASDFDYGFELGSPQSIYNLGECILLNNMIYSSRTDVSRSERDPLMWGPEFVTTGIFLIPKNTPVSYIAKYFSFDTESTLADIYKQIYAQLKSPFAIVGCVQFSQVNAEAITKAPINSENIFANSQNYYDEKKYEDTDVNFAIMGVVSNPDDKKLEQINQELSSVLYHNPFANKNKLLTHTHGLMLNKSIIDIEKVHPRNAKEVLHIQDRSLVRYIKLKVYKIKGLTKYA